MNKVALVTGGSGAVGGAIVSRLAQDGYTVAFTYLKNKDRAMRLEKETAHATGFCADLTDHAQVENMVKNAQEQCGPIEVLVNNAGRTQVMPLALIEEQDWDEIIAANLKSLFLVTREVVRGMIARKAGVIVNIGSLAGHRMLEVPVHYATAKAGVTGFTLSLARELAHYGIRVNEVVPGLLSEGVGRMVPPPELADYLKHCAAGRPGTPMEVADVVAFLAGEHALYINAQSIHVNGGI